MLTPAPGSPRTGHDSEAWRLVGPYMRLYGRNAVANSQLFNPEFIHFYIPGVGSLPYVVADIYYRVVVIAIGDPLTHKSAWRSITEKFKAQFPTAFFYHASEEYARLLHDMGYYINDVGAETTLQVRAAARNRQHAPELACADRGLRCARPASNSVRPCAASSPTCCGRCRRRWPVCALCRSRAGRTTAAPARCARRRAARASRACACAS